MIDISKNNEGDIALNYLIKVSPEFINISKETGTLKLEPIKDRTIFVSLVRAVINQQISGKASEKIYSNLIQNIGNGKYIKPTDISRSTLDNLLDCGISKNKFPYMVKKSSTVAKFTSKKVSSGVCINCVNSVSTVSLNLDLLKTCLLNVISL